MKKLLTLFLLTATFLYANTTENILNQNIKQKEITDMKSYNEFVSVMKKIISLGDTSKAYLLGLFYLQDYPFAKSNIKESIKYFKIALENPATTTQAAFYLSNLVEPIEALNYLEYSIRTETPNDKKIVLLRYLEIILTDFYKNRIFLTVLYI